MLNSLKLKLKTKIITFLNGYIILNFRQGNILLVFVFFSTRILNLFSNVITVSQDDV